MAKAPASRLNWLDRAIAFVAPTSGVERARARHVIRTYEKILGKAYEGASRGRHTQNWVTSGSSADAEFAPAASTLRNRSRDLVRNNAYAARGVGVIQANVVGAGILCQVRPSPQVGEKAPKKTAIDAAQKVWNSWADSTECDADGVHNFYGLQSLIMRAVVESGECLVRRRRRRSDSGMAVPLQLQVLEPDFIDSLRDERLSNGGVIIQGIEYDKRGRRVAYYLHTEHPGGLISSGGFIKNVIRVDASEIIHVYRKDRAGQTRGVPWLAPVVLKLRDFDEYEHAQLTRQKLAACFTAFVRDIETGEMTDEESELAEKMAPGLIELLPPGKDVTLASPPGVEGYKEFSDVTLHGVSAGLGITFESLTNDFSGVNFSSARMGQMEMQRNVESWRWNMLIPQLCDPIFAWFQESALLAVQSFEGMKPSWTPPARPVIDPTKETSAAISAIRGGLVSFSEAIRERGYDPDTHFDEVAADFKRLRKLGIVLDSDPSQTTGSGGPSNQGSAGEEFENDDDLEE